jgi:hypothetical protein
LRERRPLLLEPEDALDEAYATLGVADVEVVTGASADENLLLRDGGEFDVWYSARACLNLCHTKFSSQNESG